MRRKDHNRKYLKIMITLGIFGIILMITGCSKKASSQKATKKDQPQIKIGVDILKPFFYIDRNGSYAGIDADIAKEACKRAGYKPKFVEIPWSDRDSYLKQKKVDCVWTAFIKDQREDQYLWTDSYMTSHLAVITDKHSPSKNLEEFKGPGGIAVRAGSVAEQFFLKQSKKINENLENVYSCGTFSQAYTAFVKGYADALASHKIVLEYIMKENPEKCCYLNEDLMKVHLGVAFKRENSQENEKNGSYQKINQAIKEMKQDGTIAKIQKKYEVSRSEKSGGDENEE